MVVIEVILTKTCFLDELDSSSPVYIPKSKILSTDGKIKARAEQNLKIASKNKYGFNDIPRKYTKEQNMVRIAILGDSFIWGDGIDYDTIWSHKLEKKFSEKYESIEVMSWGHCGWSTKVQLEFLKTEGWKYQVDLLIVGFVTNDPDMGNISQNYFNSLNYIHEKKHLSLLNKFFPTFISFISAYIDRNMEKFSDTYGYVNWEKRLYTQQNLSTYQGVLTELSNFCKLNKINLLFAFTPNTYNEYFKEKYELIVPLFESLNIKYLNLYPAVYNQLRNYPERKLWADLTNGHPGDLVTSVYANEVYTAIANNLESYFSAEKIF